MPNSGYVPLAPDTKIRDAGHRSMPLTPFFHIYSNSHLGFVLIPRTSFVALIEGESESRAISVAELLKTLKGVSMLPSQMEYLNIHNGKVSHVGYFELPFIVPFHAD